MGIYNIWAFSVSEEKNWCYFLPVYSFLLEWDTHKFITVDCTCFISLMKRINIGIKMFLLVKPFSREHQKLLSGINMKCGVDLQICTNSAERLEMLLHHSRGQNVLRPKHIKRITVIFTLDHGAFRWGGVFVI